MGDSTDAARPVADEEDGMGAETESRWRQTVARRCAENGREVSRCVGDAGATARRVRQRQERLARLLAPSPLPVLA